MIILAFGVVWVGYSVTLWGRCLNKGWDITFTDLVNPVHPYQWPVPPATPPLIPKGRVWPGGPQHKRTITVTET